MTVDSEAGYGLDCVFPILLRDGDVIRAFLDAVQLPVNIFGVAPALLAAVGTF